jgi:hypothetical protein
MIVIIFFVCYYYFQKHEKKIIKRFHRSLVAKKKIYEICACVYDFGSRLRLLL